MKFGINGREAPVGISEAEATLAGLASVFFQASAPEDPSSRAVPNFETRYKALLDQIPAVVFMAYLDEGIGEAYVNPQIEVSLGFTQQEWLEDPVRWYQQIHPADKERWSLEAANMFLSGEPLRSSYRIMARDGHLVWFYCEARLARRTDGTPWFLHGVGFDITDLKETEQALQDERNMVSAILDTVGALVMVLDEDGRIIRFNRACEQTTGYTFAEVHGRRVGEIFLLPEEAAAFRSTFDQLRRGEPASEYESHWLTKGGQQRLISWSSTILEGSDGRVTHIIATGIDVTERKRLEREVLEISAREQRRIGQNLHDGLGQHLTGIAFMGKVLEDRLKEASLREAKDANNIVRLVNESIRMTRELARGLLPVVAEARGLMSALERWAAEMGDLFQIVCRFECPVPVLVYDAALAEHLFHMAREAVNNAIRHGRAKEITIRLEAAREGGVLTVRDNGAGFEVDPANQAGLGLRIMNYRATIIGGILRVKSSVPDGTEISCTFPMSERQSEAGYDR